jgi:hypothetical protein
MLVFLRPGEFAGCRPSEVYDSVDAIERARLKVTAVWLPLTLCFASGCATNHSDNLIATSLELSNYFGADESGCSSY